MTVQEAERFYSVTEVARRLEVTGPTVRAWIRDGKLNAVRLPDGAFRVYGCGLQEMLQNVPS